MGFGAILGNHWCFGQWPSKWQGRNITFLEFYPIVLSLYLWGEEMHNNCILFFTDNDALVHVINKQSCKDKLLMFCVRKLVAICLKHNILFRAKHILGVFNTLADSLSRFQVHTFRKLQHRWIYSRLQFPFISSRKAGKYNRRSASIQSTALFAAHVQTGVVAILPVSRLHFPQ